MTRTVLKGFRNGFVVLLLLAVAGVIVVRVKTGQRERCIVFMTDTAEHKEVWSFGAAGGYLGVFHVGSDPEARTGESTFSHGASSLCRASTRAWAAFG